MFELFFIVLVLFYVVVLFTLFNRKKNQTINCKSLKYFRLLIFFLMIHSVLICISLQFFADNFFLKNGDPLYLFYGPLSFLLIESCVSDAMCQKRKVFEYYHFLLGVFFLIGFLFLGLVSNSLSVIFIEAFTFIVYLLSVVSILFYSILNFSLIIRFYPSNDSTNELKYFKLVTFLFFLGILLFGYFFHDRFYLFSYLFMIVIYLVVLNVFLIRFYFNLLSEKKLPTDNFVEPVVHVVKEKIKNISEETIGNDEMKYEKAKISDELLIEYNKRIVDIINKQELYLKPDLKLDDLANLTKISRYYLGQYFSRVHNMNFNQYINKMRIEYVLLYINKNKDVVNLTVNELLAVSAFNSRTSFFRSFKDVVGVPPSEYLDIIKREKH